MFNKCMTINVKKRYEYKINNLNTYIPIMKIQLKGVFSEDDDHNKDQIPIKKRYLLLFVMWWSCLLKLRIQLVSQSSPLYSHKA